MATAMMFSQRPWLLGIQCGMLCGFLSACATMQSSPLDVAGAAPDAGIVVGSVLINTEELPTEESSLAFLGGRKTGGLTYAAVVVRADRNMIEEFFQREEYRLSGIKPGEERPFVKTLPAGDYLIDRIEATGFLADFRYQPRVFFSVARGRTTYIGQFMLQIPSRIRVGTGARMMIVNNQEQTVAALGADYAKSLTDITQNLMTIGGRRVVPGNTAASAELQRDVSSMLLITDHSENPQCAERSVVETTAISLSEERWTLDRCGTQVPYRVTFQPDPNGGTNFSVTREK